MKTTESKEHPIIMQAESVRAILDGRKTMTRRVMKPQPEGRLPICITNGQKLMLSGEVVENVHCPYGKPGDRLWVRETHWLPPEIITRRMLREGADTWPEVVYNEEETCFGQEDLKKMGWRKRPSIHMPRWASRITLEVTGVRVERLQDISTQDIIAEGIGYPSWDSADVVRAKWIELWDEINAPRGFGWEANPWCWVVEFKQIEPARAGAQTERM